MVCGFLINLHDEEVLLIDRKKKDWQCGRLNGIGGKIKKGELAFTAMQREFEEEAGTLLTGWDERVRLINLYADWMVHFFVCTTNVIVLNAYHGKAVDNEGVLRVRYLGELYKHPKILYNLKWLITLCLDDCIQFPITIFEKESYSENGSRILGWA
jgi:8-oxo-dGTP pyrophosphatase MutT (NUDIX family)